MNDREILFNPLLCLLSFVFLKPGQIILFIFSLCEDKPCGRNTDYSNLPLFIQEHFWSFLFYLHLMYIRKDQPKFTRLTFSRVYWTINSYFLLKSLFCIICKGKCIEPLSRLYKWKIVHTFFCQVFIQIEMNPIALKLN